MRVGIIGSCVTRDAFELPRREGIVLDAYFARSSLASACTDRRFGGVDTSVIESAFQRRIVGFDLDKAFLDYLEADGFDVLVYDPIDERFDLMLQNGAVATRSNEFMRASFDDDAIARVPSSTAEFVALWERGWSRLLKVLDAHGKRGALRVNEVYWATTARGDVDLAKTAPRERTRAANEFLARLYQRMRADLDPHQFYTYAEDVLVAADEHRWGISPFHYVPEFYQAFVRRLEGEGPFRHGARRNSPWVGVSDEPHDREVDLLRGADDVQCDDRVYNYKGRHIVHSVHPRPSSRRLIIVFSGVDATPGTTRMSYFGMGRSLDATVVHIKDGFGSHGSYLLAVANDRQVRNAVLSLIRELQGEFDVPTERTFMIGTSKGGATAIAYALMLGGGHVLAGEPQVMIGDFVFGDAVGTEGLTEWQRSLAYAMLGRVDADDRDVLNSMIPEVVERYGPRFRGSIEVLVGNTGYLERHIGPLVDGLGSCGRADQISLTRFGFTEHNDVVPVFVARAQAFFGSPPGPKS
ncbi:DUF6270 domain-containing protein [Cellulomonas carbonis]|uniref:Uncharacterized protein n=1 Tax=Cellulomonas carbonis T26 TaxID=947969 RepID=A0A0A0BUT3_9CELL|nr:DUF6270 domain-containing protein [Cellulomonas carbonis]KGM11462.1 hypothetical protein N868_08930 [Cellulomonas carbonis T26]GGC10716.1 hypothetical protein GCM10010972_25040 [Cellulomonas carbonis]